VSIVGFGTFKVRSRKARMGRNPKTGAKIKIKASKTVGFKAREAVQGVDLKKSIVNSRQLTACGSPARSSANR